MGSAKITNGLEYLAMSHTAESLDALVSRLFRMELEVRLDARRQSGRLNLGGKIFNERICSFKIAFTI